MLFFFFKQKTAYEMRIIDWSSDVCSSDLSLLAGSLLGSGAAFAESLTKPDGVIIIESNNRRSIIVIPGNAFGFAVEPVAARGSEKIRPAAKPADAVASPVTFTTTEPSSAAGMPER